MEQTLGGLAEVMTELMPEQLSEVLEEHVVATGKMVRSTATVLSSGHLLSKAIALIDLDEAAIERAIMAQVPERDSEGNTYMVDPGEWTQYQRRAFIHDALTKAQNQSAKMLGMAIRLQREAHGLDFSQELTSALARVMAAGFTVVR
jgi:polyhydroxyalkanoate synthesis regulator phasin